MSFSSNFTFLKAESPELFNLGSLAECYLGEDPNTSLMKIGQLAEILAQLIASKKGISINNKYEQIEIIKTLKDLELINEEVNRLFHKIRQARNEATHQLQGDYPTALIHLEYAYHLSVWYCKTYSNNKYNHTNPFITPPKSHSLTILQLYSQYQETLNKLELSISNLNLNQKQGTSLHHELSSIKTRADKLDSEIVKIKNLAKERQIRKADEINNRKKQLREKVSKLESVDHKVSF